MPSRYSWYSLIESGAYFNQIVSGLVRVHRSYLAVHSDPLLSICPDSVNIDSLMVACSLSVSTSWFWLIWRRRTGGRVNFLLVSFRFGLRIFRWGLHWIVFSPKLHHENLKIILIQ